MGWTNIYEVIVSTDQPLMRRFHEQYDSIARRLQRMICQLALPYCLALLPTLVNPDEMLAVLMKSKD